MLVHTVPKDLHELLQNRCLAAVALLREAGAVVIVAKDVALVLVVTVLRAKHGGADRAGEVLDVVFAVKSGDIGAAKRASTCIAQQVKPAEVVGLAERVLVWRLVGHGEEFRGDDFVAVLSRCQRHARHVRAGYLNAHGR